MKPLNIQDPFLFGEWFDISWFHSCYVPGMVSAIKERLGYGLSQYVAEQEGNIHRNYFSRSEWTGLGKRFLEEIIVDHTKLATILQETRETADNLIRWLRNFNLKTELPADPEEQLILLSGYHAIHHRLWTLGMIPNILELENSFLTDYLKAWLRQQNLSAEQQADAFQALVTPRELSRAQHEERAMLALATAKEPGENLVRHWKENSWLQFGWVGPSLTLDYFTEVHRGLLREGKAAERLATLLAQDEKLVEDKEKLLAQLAVPPNIAELFRLLEELLFIKSHRMDAFFMSYEAVQPLLEKIAQTHYLSLRQVYFLYFDWLAEMVKKNKINIDYINELVRYSVHYYDGESFHVLTGDAARKITASIKTKLPPPEIKNELRGECAFRGMVRGRVKIVNRADEMDKFIDGDILVSNVTDPTLLPIMKKAAAFVTNMGGLTCHAAIVARELKKPCIVGTKIATHVFKDGDMVEVDAEKGSVRKI